MVDSAGKIKTTRDAIKAVNLFWTSRIVSILVMGLTLFGLIANKANLDSFWTITLYSMGLNFETLMVLMPYVFMFFSGLGLAWSLMLTVDLKRVTRLLLEYHKHVSFSTICVYGVLIFVVLLMFSGIFYITYLDHHDLDFIALGTIMYFWLHVVLLHVTEIVYKAILLVNNDDPEEIIKNHSLI